MPRVGTPQRPGSAVLDPGWVGHHQPVADNALPDRCVVRGPDGPPVFDPALGRSVATPGAVRYDGPCRVRALGPTEIATGGQLVTISGYRVTLVLATSNGVEADDRLTVTVTSDLTLVNEVLHVRGTERGSLLWQRDLICSGDQD